jgi:phenylacetate-CoA ligase
VTRKSDLVALQQAAPPFGGLGTRGLGEFRRVFASPGPLFEPERLGRDPWRLARALHAAGLRAGELVHNTFSYHFTPAGRMLESAAHELGCPVFAAGVGQSALQAQTMAALRPVAYCGTPSFLKILLDKADELDLEVSSLVKGLVSGEAFPGALRTHFQERGVALLQCYATADVGLIAYESSPESGLIVDEGVILEIVRPGTGEPVAAGEVGEVLVTTLDDDYPLLRFATGDLSAEMAGASPCGRTNRRIAGWMGRADQTSKVRGMFVHPAMVADVLRRCPGAGRGRLVVGRHDHQDTLVLECERAGRDDALAQVLAAAVRDVTKLRAEVRFVEPGQLPNDGQVIVDTRSHD